MFDSELSSLTLYVSHCSVITIAPWMQSVDQTLGGVSFHGASVTTDGRMDGRTDGRTFVQLLWLACSDLNVLKDWLYCSDVKWACLISACDQRQLGESRSSEPVREDLQLWAMNVWTTAATPLYSSLTLPWCYFKGCVCYYGFLLHLSCNKVI